MGAREGPVSCGVVGGRGGGRGSEWTRDTTWW